MQHIWKHFSACLCVMFLCRLPAQTPPVPSANDVEKQVLTLAQKNFLNVQSLQASVTTVRTFGIGFKEIQPTRDLSQPLTFKFDYWESGTSWKYEMHNATKGKERFMALQAVTGGLYQYIEPDGNRMLFLNHKAQVQHNAWLNSENMLFEPFSFLYQNTSNDPNYRPAMPALSDVISEANWTQLISNTKLASSSQPANSVADVATLIYQVRGDTDKPYHSSAYTYEIDFSKQYGYYPVGFRKRNKQGNIVQEFSCKKMGSVTNGNVTFYYPSETVYKGYDNKGQLVLTNDSSITDLKVNSVDEHDDLFTIDPSMARRIYDGDKGVDIPVPQ